MLRLLLTYLSDAAWARNIVQSWGFAKKTASRFVAGETLDQAIEVVKSLNRRGITTTLDHLGENVNSAEEANQAAREILKIIDRLKEEEVTSGVSIKLSQIGLVIDKSICEKNLYAIFAKAKDKNIFVRVDMEDSELTQTTLDLYQKVVKHGYEDYAGIAIQAYLYRSETDVIKLIKGGTRIRLCKGAYKEPRTIAFPKKGDVDLNFDKLSDLLLKKSQNLDSRISPDGRVPPIPAIATHDQARIDHTLAFADKINLGKDNLEFQMLHGIREDLQNMLIEKGYPVRVYVPYGQEWYPYFVRRLAERPANLWFFLSNLLRNRS
jgi:proline dehydrogenase